MSACLLTNEELHLEVKRHTFVESFHSARVSTALSVAQSYTACLKFSPGSWSNGLERGLETLSNSWTWPSLEVSTSANGLLLMRGDIETELRFAGRASHCGTSVFRMLVKAPL